MSRTGPMFDSNSTRQTVCASPHFDFWPPYLRTEVEQLACIYRTAQNITSKLKLSVLGRGKPKKSFATTLPEGFGLGEINWWLNPPTSDPPDPCFSRQTRTYQKFSSGYRREVLSKVLKDGSHKSTRKQGLTHSRTANSPCWNASRLFWLIKNLTTPS